MQGRIDRAGRFLEKLGGFIIAGIGFVMGIALTYYSARYTELCTLDEDIPRTSPDNAVVNMVVLVVVMIVFGLLYHIRNKLIRIEKTLLVLTLICSFLCGIVWVLTSHVKPTADANSVCVVAASMLQGDFPMQPPTYMSYNPQQYGMVFILQCMFARFGAGNFTPWQVMNALLFPVLIFAGYRILRLLTQDSMVCIFYLILTLGYLPFYLYLPYVYGDFPSVACGMVITWQTIAFCKKGRISSIIFAMLAAVFGCLVRKNTIIVVIAAVLVLLICGIKKIGTAQAAEVRHGLGMFLMTVVLCVSVWASAKAVLLYYESISGQKVFSGIPNICYIMMGLEDTEKGPGWFNGDNYMALVRTDYDSAAAEIYGKDQVQARLRELWQDKSYTLDFFRRKILTQWNMPDCLALHETGRFTCEPEELPAVVKELYFGNGYDRAMNYMNRYQFVLYAFFAVAMGSMLFGKKREMEYYLPMAAILGGFFFSILWEAMSRYVLAYEGYMILLTAIGMWEMQKMLAAGIAGAGKRLLKSRN